MKTFSEWIRIKEEAAAGAPAAAPAAPAAPPSGGDSGGESGGGDTGTPSDGGTTTNDVARVPMRLGAWGLCYPHCSCSSCRRKRKKRKKGRRRGKK